MQPEGGEEHRKQHEDLLASEQRARRRAERRHAAEQHLQPQPGAGQHLHVAVRVGDQVVAVEEEGGDHGVHERDRDLCGRAARVTCSRALASRAAWAAASGRTSRKDVGGLGPGPGGWATCQVEDA